MNSCSFKRIYSQIPILRELIQLREYLRILTESNAAATIRLLDFGLETHPRYSDPLRLLRYASQVCSQNGEDGMIREIFRRIGVRYHTFAEVGVGNGGENNTAFLLSQGWTGVWLDGATDFLETISRRPDLHAGIRGKGCFVNKENIAALFEELGVDQEFDLLSLDIDQNTYYAWDGLRDFRPRVVVVEYNSCLPADLDWKVNYDPLRTWDGSNNFGASLKAFEKLGENLGYKLVGCDFIGSNAFFVREDLVEDKFAAPFTAENHHEPPRFPLVHRRGRPSAILDRAIESPSRGL